MNNLIRAFRFQPVHSVIFALMVALFVGGSLVSERFATWLNISNIQDQLVVLSLVALAQTIVILSGGIDLSYAGLMSLVSVLFAGLVGESPESFALTVLGILVLGTALGALNGGLTVYTGIHPLVVTLATSTIMAGGALLYTKQPAGSIPIFYEDFAYGRWGIVPYGTLFALGLYLLLGFVLWRTKFGLRVYAIGDDEYAASISGIPVKKTQVLIYALSGLLASLAALYLVGRFGIGDPRAGVGFDLKSITPVIVGGTLLSGGKGGVFGTALSVVLLALLANVLTFLNVSSFYQWIVEGLIIIGAVSFFAQRSQR